MAFWGGHVVSDPLEKGNPMPPSDHVWKRIAALETKVKRLEAAIRVLAKLQVGPKLDDVLEALDPNHRRKENPYG